MKKIDERKLSWQEYYKCTPLITTNKVTCTGEELLDKLNHSKCEFIDLYMYILCHQDCSFKLIFQTDGCSGLTKIDSLKMEVYA